MRKKILISAYAVSPYRGSEYAASWNTINQIAKNHDVWVLFGMSDNHMGDTETLWSYVKNNPNPAITFIEVRGSILANSINLLNKAGAGWFFYFAYYLWQKQALQAARKLLETVDIDVVHQLGPIGYREPGFLWKLDKPLVWGPIGGMMAIDKRLLKGKPMLTRLMFMVKNLVNHVQLNYSGRIKAAFEYADVLIAATTDGQSVIREKFGKESIHLPETWLVHNARFAEEKFDGISKRVRLVWSGTHNERKNLQLCLHALALVKQNNWVLNVLGSGPLTRRLKRLARKLHIDQNIIWCGQLDRADAIKIMQTSHLHILTSIAEDNPNVLYEALSYGVPTLSIDHFGMADAICPQSGIKILVDENEVIANKMAGIVSHLLDNPQILKDMAQATLLSAGKFQWDKRLAKLNLLYNQAIARHRERVGQPIMHHIVTAV
jgi:glycosyltransferase involved in cell wall biosynthesis